MARITFTLLSLTWLMIAACAPAGVDSASSAAPNALICSGMIEPPNSMTTLRIHVTPDGCSTNLRRDIDYIWNSMSPEYREYAMTYSGYDNGDSRKPIHIIVSATPDCPLEIVYRHALEPLNEYSGVFDIYLSLLDADGTRITGVNGPFVGQARTRFRPPGFISRGLNSRGEINKHFLRPNSQVSRLNAETDLPARTRALAQDLVENDISWSIAEVVILFQEPHHGYGATCRILRDLITTSGGRIAVYRFSSMYIPPYREIWFGLEIHRTR